MSTELFAASLCALFEELNWPLLGESYCSEGGELFFDEQRRADILDVGLRCAADLGEAFEQLASARAASLYVGASAAELAPMLFEVLVAGRTVDARNIPGPETNEINRALAVIEERNSVRLPRLNPEPIDASPGTFDHVWLVGVLTDPDAFPALHDELYERHGTPAATGRGEFTHDRTLAVALIERALASVAKPFLWTTSDEELSLTSGPLGAAGAGLEALDLGWISPVVGDHVRIHVGH